MRKFHRTVISILSLGMAFSCMPVHAEESMPTTSPTPSSEAADQSENSETTSSSPSASPSDDAGDVVIEGSAPKTTVTANDSEEKTGSKNSDNAVPITDKDILAAADGDTDRAGLLDDAQAYIEAEKGKAPHFTLFLAGNGAVEVTDASGTITEYRRGGKSVTYVPADSPEESKEKVEEANKSIQEAEKDVSEIEKNNTRVYAITGNSGDKIHLKAVADDGENIVSLVSQDSYSVTSASNEALVSADDPKTEYEADVTLREHACVSWIASFSELKNPFVMTAASTGSDGGSTGKNNLLRAPTLSLIGRSPISNMYTTSGGGYVYISGHHPDGGYGAYYYNRFTISNPTDPTLRAALNQVGGSNEGACQNHGDYAPPSGTYRIDWTMTVYDDGSTYVSYTVRTRDISARAAWGVSGSYVNYHPWLQSVSGAFSTPPTNKNITVSISKKSTNSSVLNLFTDSFSLQGASFDIFLDSGCTNKMASVTTDANGNASTTATVNVGVNEVWVRETEAPKGFQKNNDTFHVWLNNNSGHADVSDRPNQEHVKIIKNDNNGNPIPGAYLKMVNKDTGWSTSWISDGTPHPITCDPGNYTLSETVPPEGYYPADPINFTVYPSKDNQTYTMKDIPIRYGADKVDKDTGEPVADAKMQLWDDQRNVIIEEWTTTAETHIFGTDPSQARNGWNGKLVWGHEYTVREDKSPTGYELNYSPVTFTIDTVRRDVQIVHVEPFKNIKLNYYVAKLDADTNEYIKGVTLELLNDKNKVIDRWVTDGKPHKITPKLLELGKTYYVHEAQTAPGYYFMANDVPFTVANSGGLPVEIKAYDYKIKYQIEKVDADTPQVHVGGITMAVYDKTTDGTLIDKWVTDSDSGTPLHTLDFSKLNAGHTYILKEIATVPGYYLNDTPKEFTISQKSDYDYLKYPVTVTLKDPRISIYVAKLDGLTNKPVSGAKLQIKDSDGNVMTEITTTDQKELKIDASKYVAGKTYYLEEVKPVDGYYYMQDKVRIDIPATWKDAIKQSVVTGIHVTGYDYPIKYQVQKADQNGNPVAGAVFALYKGSQKVFGWTSTTEPYYIDPQQLNLVAGETYTVKEVGAPKGYYHSSDIVFKIPKFPTEKADIEKVIHGEVVTEQFTDQSVKWKIYKYEVSSGKKTILYSKNGVPFTFEVYDVTSHPNEAVISDNDKKIADLSTDDLDYITNGYFELSSQLEAGHYYRVREVSCPNGYTKAPDTKAIYIPTDTSKTASGEDYSLKTEITDESFSIKLRKVDENGNKLVSYTSQPDGIVKYFTFDIFDTASNQKIATVDTRSDEYKNTGYIDLSSKLVWGHTYKVVETTYPTGYYRAQDAYINVNKASIDIKMTDPKVKAKFRKDNEDGEPLRDGFKFAVVEAATGKSVAMLDMSKADAQGFVSFGENLKENTAYKIVEIDHTADYTTANPVNFTTPKYYQED